MKQKYQYVMVHSTKGIKEGTNSSTKKGCVRLFQEIMHVADLKKWYPDYTCERIKIE